MLKRVRRINGGEDTIQTIRLVGLYSLPSLLQFFDWLTTRIVISYNPLVELNPLVHSKFSTEGVSYWDLIPKILFGILWGMLLMLADKGYFKYLKYDTIIGVSVWGMLPIVINNSMVVAHDIYLKYLGIWRPARAEDLFIALINSITNNFTWLIILLMVSWWIYRKTQRTFLFSASVVQLILIAMAVIQAYKYYKI